MFPLMISILILTKNEEQDLPACLQSVSWSDDIHVFDSFSSDGTVAIAEKFGAKVTQRFFDGYASQRNAALRTVDYKYDWIFVLDADERVSEELRSEIHNAAKLSLPEVGGFSIQRKDFLNDTWLKHAQISPFYIRLFRKNNASYKREVNEVVEIAGKVEKLKGSIHHYPFSKGYAHWLNKHNRYSTMEAEQWLKEHTGQSRFSVKKAIFGASFHEKRYHQKGLFYRLPFRPLIKWSYIFVWRRGFMDGKAGFTYATMQAIYEYFIIIKSKELEKRMKTSAYIDAKNRFKDQVIKQASKDVIIFSDEKAISIKKIASQF